MGFLSKSGLLILLVAIATPLLYRQFANDNTIKFMGSYYSNYGKIDQFLRQTANHMDRAKDYIPDKKQVLEFVDRVQSKVNILIDTSKDKINSFRSSKIDQAKAGQPVNEEDRATQKHRMSSCPGEESRLRLWTKEELARFDGSSGDEVYLGFLGLVYDVSVNAQHYGPGAEYNVFAGRDATRAFITGNFTHDLTDDIKDIEESYYSHIESWASFYGSTYKALGRIEGAFFDSQGCETPELARVYKVFNKLAQDRAKQQEMSKLLPECNSEWNADLNSGRVWCTTKSGGVERDWVGVPRLKSDDESNHCVCVNLETLDPSQQDKFRIYAGCDPNASECALK